MFYSNINSLILIYLIYLWTTRELERSPHPLFFTSHDHIIQTLSFREHLCTECIIQTNWQTIKPAIFTYTANRTSYVPRATRLVTLQRTHSLQWVVCSYSLKLKIYRYTTCPLLPLPFSSAHISPSTSQTSLSKSFLKVRREKETENYQKSTKDLNHTTVHFVHPVITDHVSTVVMLGINIEGPAVKWNALYKAQVSQRYSSEPWPTMKKLQWCKALWEIILQCKSFMHLK